MEPADAPAESILFSYFLVRLRGTARGPDVGLAGMVERLGTGEKRSFASADELLALVAGWRGASASIEETSPAGQPADDAPPTPSQTRVP